jgi:20S proteasome alpha/beta subunit
MSIEEAAELARRAIYHATFRDGASGGVASGKALICLVTYTDIAVKKYDIVAIFLYSLLRWTRRLEETLWR